MGEKVNSFCFHSDFVIFFNKKIYIYNIYIYISESGRIRTFEDSESTGFTILRHKPLGHRPPCKIRNKLYNFYLLYNNNIENFNNKLI